MTTDHDEIYKGRVARDEKNYPAMTHDELLADINKYYSDIESGLRWEPDCYIKALRAVVELHKPFTPMSIDRVLCMHCSLGSQYEVEYPCPTIQAIERELR